MKSNLANLLRLLILVEAVARRFACLRQRACDSGGWLARVGARKPLV